MLTPPQKPQQHHDSCSAGTCREPKSTRITTKNRLLWLARMLQRQKSQKSTSFIVKTPVKSTVNGHREVRELPRKMNIDEVGHKGSLPPKVKISQGQENFHVRVTPSAPIPPRTQPPQNPQQNPASRQKRLGPKILYFDYGACSGNY